MVITTHKKSDFLTPNQFAKKHNLDPKKALEMAAYLYKKQVCVPASVQSTKPNIIIKSRTAHHSDAFIIHPLGTEVFLNEYNKRNQHEI